jgi:hypothetical protein
MAALNPASLEELSATVARMEGRLAQSDDPFVVLVWRAYEALAARFEKDLGGAPRDVALAKASALMLVQGVAQLRKRT